MAFSQPFTQLSIEIWEDVDLWLPVDKLYTDTYLPAEDMKPIVKDLKWEYLFVMSWPLLNHQDSTVLVKFGIDKDHRENFPYKAWIARLNLPLSVDSSFFLVAMKVFISSNDYDAGDSFTSFQVVKFYGESGFYPYSCVILDLFPKPDKKGSAVHR